MKTIRFKHLFILICVSISLGAGCNKDDEITSYDKLIGKWVEEDPLLYDGISDTIVFTKNNLIEKHFFFKGWIYKVKECDTITFTHLEDKFDKKIEFISDDKIVLYSFIDRLLTSEVKNITFIKIK